MAKKKSPKEKDAKEKGASAKAAEIEFLYLLIYRDAPVDLRKRFLGEHLGKWVRPFTQAVHVGAETAFYRELARLTDGLIAMEASRVIPERRAR